MQMTSALLLLVLAQPKEIVVRLPDVPSVVRWTDGGKRLLMVSDGCLREWPSGRSLSLPYEVASDYETSAVSEGILSPDDSRFAYKIGDRRAVIVNLKTWQARVVPIKGDTIAFRGQELISLGMLKTEEYRGVIYTSKGSELLPKGRVFYGIEPHGSMVFTTIGPYDDMHVVAYKKKSYGQWVKYAVTCRLPSEPISDNWYAIHEKSGTFAFGCYWDTGATWEALGVARHGWRGQILQKDPSGMASPTQLPLWKGDELFVVEYAWWPTAGRSDIDSRIRVILYGLDGQIKKVLYNTAEGNETSGFLYAADYDLKTRRLALACEADDGARVIIRAVTP